MRDSKFRIWCQHKWYEHVEEYREWNKCNPTDAYTQEVYFKRYKYWLKREFQHQQKTVDQKSH